MKILIVQLARFGDVVLTIPTIRAIAREHPGAELHTLVRQRFHRAMAGVVESHKLIKLDTEEIIKPLISDPTAIDQSLKVIKDLQNDLLAKSYDLIINLSFSPFSSYLVHSISHDKTKVRGYTRYSDGYLCLPDMGSGYFYSQVGTDRKNRIHLLLLFAWVAKVALQECDIRPPESASLQDSPPVEFSDIATGEEYFVIHFGASEAHKRWPIQKWVELIYDALSVWSGKIVLVGTAEEANIWHKHGESRPTIINLLGKTEILDLYAICSGAKFVVGGDSLLMHVATLCHTPCLNLSFEGVNYWETGPFSMGSYIIKEKNPELLASHRVLELMFSLMHLGVSGATLDSIQRSPFIRSYELVPVYFSQRDQEVEWSLINKIYFNGTELPSWNVELRLGLSKLIDLTKLVLSQIDWLESGKGDIAVILNSMGASDRIFDKIEELCPELTPLIAWYRCLKICIGPGPVSEVIKHTAEKNQKFLDMLEILTEDNQELSFVGNQLGEGVDFSKA